MPTRPSTANGRRTNGPWTWRSMWTRRDASAGSVAPSTPPWPRSYDYRAFTPRTPGSPCPTRRASRFTNPSAFGRLACTGGAAPSLGPGTTSAVPTGARSPGPAPPNRRGSKGSTVERRARRRRLETASSSQYLIEAFGQLRARTHHGQPVLLRRKHADSHHHVLERNRIAVEEDCLVQLE